MVFLNDGTVRNRKRQNQNASSDCDSLLTLKELPVFHLPMAKQLRKIFHQRLNGVRSIRTYVMPKGLIRKDTNVICEIIWTDSTLTTSKRSSIPTRRGTTYQQCTRLAVRTCYSKTARKDTTSLQGSIGAACSLFILPWTSAFRWVPLANSCNNELT